MINNHTQQLRQKKMLAAWAKLDELLSLISHSKPKGIIYILLKTMLTFTHDTCYFEVPLCKLSNYRIFRTTRRT